MTWTGDGRRPLDQMVVTSTPRGQQWIAQVGHNLLVVVTLHPQAGSVP